MGWRGSPEEGLQHVPSWQGYVLAKVIPDTHV